MGLNVVVSIDYITNKIHRCLKHFDYKIYTQIVYRDTLMQLIHVRNKRIINLEAFELQQYAKCVFIGKLWR